MRLDELPADIVHHIPQFLYSLDDLYALIRTSRAFYNCCADSKVQLRPVFAARHGQPAFHPHPHLLIAGSVRSVADWAVCSMANEHKLQRALEQGIDGLFTLCAEEGRMNLQEARTLHSTKYEVLNPFLSIVDAAIGPLYSPIDRTFHDNVSEWRTIMDYPELSVLNHWIYCELFHHSVDASIIARSSIPVQLTNRTRFLFLSYLLPDFSNHRIKIPPEIVEQAYCYAHPPWQNTRNPAFFYIQRTLYRKGGALFNTDAIKNALVGKLYDQEKERLRDEVVINQSSSISAEMTSESIFYNFILHTAPLCFQILLPGGFDATKNAVKQLRLKFKAFSDTGELSAAPADDENDNNHGLVGNPWHGLLDDIMRILHS